MKFPTRILNIALSVLNFLNSDKLYLKVMFYQRLGYWPNLKEPKSLNEKIQWIKLNDRNPKYSEYADKYKVRDHIKNTIGEEYLIPLIGVYNTPNDINFEKLPNQFVLKCNHGYGCNIICHDKSKLDIKRTKSLLARWLKTDYSQYKREYHYKAIKPCIICEEYMIDKKYKELFDYKFFCFQGEVEMIQVDLNRFDNHTRNLYDKNWNLLDLQISFPNNKEINLKKPEHLDKMILLAKELSREFPFVRVDFYVINERIYFGEMTFTSGAGFSRYNPICEDFRLGSLLTLNKNKYTI